MSSNTRLLIILLTVAAGFLGLSYAFVPLYKVFCQALGIPLPSIAVNPEMARLKPVGAASGRVITVKFAGESDATMPVQLQPHDTTLQVRLGEPALTAYKAVNPTGKGLNGIAVHMIIAMGGPDNTNVNQYVNLQQCFCFEEQYYPARQTVNLPLSFTVTPDLPPNVHTLVFNYTLFPAEKAPIPPPQALDKPSSGR